MKIDKNISDRNPRNGMEIMYLLLNNMNADCLAEHVKKLNRTRRRAVSYNLNGRCIFIPRAMARDAAKERLGFFFPEEISKRRKDE